uniref:Fatty acyl-CoA reductase n=1 Tax=Quercus lobata TaxID=97700 RepID=A0A7N2MRP6_QUELO
MCPLCDSDDESATHLFIHCPFSRACWYGSHLAIQSSKVVAVFVQQWVSNTILEHRHMEEENMKCLQLFFIIIWYQEAFALSNCTNGRSDGPRVQVHELGGHWELIIKIAGVRQKRVKWSAYAYEAINMFVEKILRVQPNVKRLYLLVRALDNESVTQSFREEVIEKDIFRVLRNNLGANLESFIFERVTPISCDISDDNFGIKDSILREEMWKEIDMVLNSGATTNFDERYDVAFGVNTYGALHVLNFAKKCIKLKLMCLAKRGVTYLRAHYTWKTGQREPQD